jgi:AcrR family transcriptional regulator
MPKISQDHRDSRRQQILDAALACFSEDGFHQTGMAAIVQRSGLSHGAVYGYFASKDDIIEALAAGRHEREAILNAVAQQAGNPLEALRRLLHAYTRSLADPAALRMRRVGVHGWAEALRSKRVHARVVEGIAVPRNLISGLIGQAQSMGLLAGELSADALARSLIALFQGLVLQVVWGEDIDLDACAAVIEQMLRGLCPVDPQPGPRPPGGA